MNDTTFILVFGVMLATSLILWVMRSDYHKSRIRRHLESAGATDIDISQRLFEFDHGNTFEVAYLDRDGRAHRSICKVGASLFGGDINWTETSQ